MRVRVVVKHIAGGEDMRYDGSKPITEATPNLITAEEIDSLVWAIDHYRNCHVEGKTKDHLASIYYKLGVTNIIAAYRRARILGLIE